MSPTLVVLKVLYDILFLLLFDICCCWGVSHVESDQQRWVIRNFFALYNVVVVFWDFNWHQKLNLAPLLVLMMLKLRMEKLVHNSSTVYELCCIFGCFMLLICYCCKLLSYFGRKLYNLVSIFWIFCLHPWDQKFFSWNPVQICHIGWKFRKTIQAFSKLQIC